MTDEKRSVLAEVQIPESPAPCVGQAGNSSPAIRFMDEETFRRSLEKVMVAHERLLAKLAE